MLKPGSTFAAMPSSVRTVRISKMTYGGVYMSHVKPMSPSTALIAPKREPVSAQSSMRALSSAAITSGKGRPLGCVFCHASPSRARHSSGSPTKPVSMNARTSPS